MSYEEVKLKELRQSSVYKDPKTWVDEVAEAVIRLGGPIEKGNWTFWDKIKEIKDSDFNHLSTTFVRYPIGIHGVELPSFRNEGKKEYWKTQANYSPDPKI